MEGAVFVEWWGSWGLTWVCGYDKLSVDKGKQETSGSWLHVDECAASRSEWRANKGKLREKKGGSGMKSMSHNSDRGGGSFGCLPANSP